MWSKFHSCSISLEEEKESPRTPQIKIGGSQDCPEVQTNSKISSISSASRFSIFLSSHFTSINSLIKFILHSSPGG